MKVNYFTKLNIQFFWYCKVVFALDVLFLLLNEISGRKNMTRARQSCLPRRKTFEVERTFHESAEKPSWNHWQTYLKDGELYIKIGQVMGEELESVLKKN